MQLPKAKDKNIKIDFNDKCFKKSFGNPPLRVLSTPGIVQTQSEKNLRKLMAKDKKRKRDLLNKERKGGKESIEDNEILLDVEG